jgi:hypothetical protein
MKPSWATKTDPKLHPDRFLASIWEQKMRANFGISVSVLGDGKKMGQLRNLRMHLGDLTRDVVEWIVEPSNWWLFCQQIRAEEKNHRVSDQPDIGLLLMRRGTALRLIRSSNCSASADLVKKLEQREYDRIKALLLATYAKGKPERLAKIHTAKTLADMQRVFIEFTDEDTAALQELASSL